MVYRQASGKCRSPQFVQYSPLSRRAPKQRRIERNTQQPAVVLRSGKRARRAFSSHSISDQPHQQCLPPHGRIRGNVLATKAGDEAFRVALDARISHVNTGQNEVDYAVLGAPTPLYERSRSSQILRMRTAT